MQKPAVSGEALADLRRELAGRREHQSANSRLAATPSSLGQMLEDGKRKGGGLSRTCLCTAEDIATVQKWRNGLDLNRRRLVVSLALERLAQRR